MSVLSKRYFHDEAAAFEHLEQVLWGNEPVCPHCGTLDHATKLQGAAHRIGVWKCKTCRKQFTVKVGTVFEHGRIPLHKFLQAAYLMSASKKGVSAHQLHRTLEVTYKTAWFLAHRIREAMRDGSLPPMGGEGKTVEIDETVQGRLAGAPGTLTARTYGGWATPQRRADAGRAGGRARSFHVERTTIATMMPIIRANVSRESAVMTDAASWYKFMNCEGEFASHDRLDHSAGEYVRYGERLMHTNTVEGFYSIFECGMRGVYQHCSEKPLPRYLAEFDFRFSHRFAIV